MRLRSRDLQPTAARARRRPADGIWVSPGLQHFRLGLRLDRLIERFVTYLDGFFGHERIPRKLLPVESANHAGAGRQDRH